MEEQEIVRFTLRISQELFSKFGYIAEYNGRTKNKELERLIKSSVSSFEKRFGEIKSEKED